MHTHALDEQSRFNPSASVEATPVLWDGTLYLDGPFDQVYALNAATGQMKWIYDPHVPRKDLYITSTLSGVGSHSRL
jgi:glucose dehydrogenase